MENKKVLNAKLEFLNSIAGVLSPLQQSLSIIKDSTSNQDVKSNLSNELQNISKQKLDIDKTINESKEKLKDIEKNINLGVLTLPAFGTVDSPKAENLIAFCSHFSGYENECFNEFFSKVKSYSEFSQLSEKGFKLVLSGLLRADAFELFNDNKHKTASEIIKILSERFTNKIGILNYDLQLKTFKRNTSDNLATAMNKIDFLINKTSALVPPDQRESRRDFLLLEMLLRIVDSHTRSKIRSAQLDSTREGIALTYNDIFQIALYSEMDRSENYKSFLAHSAVAEANITEPLPSAESFLATPIDYDWEDSQIPREDSLTTRENSRIPRGDSPVPWEELQAPSSYDTYHHDEYPYNYFYEDNPCDDLDTDDYRNHELEISRKIISKLPQIIQTICLNDPSKNKSYNK